MSKYIKVLAVLGVLALSACAGSAPPAGEINDPFEDVNRQVHEFNKLADAAILRPASQVYGATVPEGVRDVIDNSANNLALPGQAINHTLQGDIPAAFKIALRFVMNTTLGIGGMFDPASEVGLFANNTDFGETLGVWGVAEGPYIELPFLGGSTVRDTAGMAVDFAIDPMAYVIPSPEREYLFLLKGVDLVGDRHEYADLVDVLLYESADSYASQRLSYLSNKRRNLEGETEIEDLEDPYAFE